MRKEGYWDLTAGLAPALMAHDSGGSEAHLGGPLDFTLGALKASVPNSLRQKAAEAAGAGRGTVDPERLWATLCVIQSLEIMEFSWRGASRAPRVPLASHLRPTCVPLAPHVATGRVRPTYAQSKRSTSPHALNARPAARPSVAPHHINY